MTFPQILNQDKRSLGSATWCCSRKTIRPILEDLKKNERDKTGILKIDTDKTHRHRWRMRYHE